MKSMSNGIGNVSSNVTLSIIITFYKLSILIYKQMWFNELNYFVNFSKYVRGGSGIYVGK